MLASTVSPLRRHWEVSRTLQVYSKRPLGITLSLLQRTIWDPLRSILRDYLEILLGLMRGTTQNSWKSIYEDTFPGDNFHSNSYFVHNYGLYCRIVRVITAVIQRNTDNKFPISIRKCYSNRITISGEQITVIFSYFAYSSAQENEKSLNYFFNDAP